MTENTIAARAAPRAPPRCRCAQPSDRKLNHQHDQQRLDEGLEELGDGSLDDLRLVGDLRHLDADRKARL
jgi:hypothetical protein